MEKINTELYSEVKSRFYGDLLKKQKLLTLNFSDNFINELCQVMEEKYMGSNEIL